MRQGAELRHIHKTNNNAGGEKQQCGGVNMMCVCQEQRDKKRERRQKNGCKLSPVMCDNKGRGRSGETNNSNHDRKRVKKQTKNPAWKGGRDEDKREDEE